MAIISLMWPMTSFRLASPSGSEISRFHLSLGAVSVTRSERNERPSGVYSQTQNSVQKAQSVEHMDGHIPSSRVKKLVAHLVIHRLVCGVQITCHVGLDIYKQNGDSSLLGNKDGSRIAGISDALRRDLVVFRGRE